MSLYVVPIGSYEIEAAAGEWWLGDRNCIRIWGPCERSGDATEWPHVLTIRWRSWRVTSNTRVIAHARRGIRRSLYVPDLEVPATASQEGEPSDG